MTARKADLATDAILKLLPVSGRTRFAPTNQQQPLILNTSVTHHSTKKTKGGDPLIKPLNNAISLVGAPLRSAWLLTGRAGGGSIL